MDITTTVRKDPHKLKALLIVSHVKVGKTELCTKLPNNFIINFDGSLEHYGVGEEETNPALGVNIIEDSADRNLNVISNVKRMAKEIAKAKKENNNIGPFDYITIDTITELERHCEPYAKRRYQATPQGADFTGNLLTDLDYGAGYLKLRDAFNEVLRLYWNLPNKCLILLGHLRESSVRTRKTTVSAVDIGLTGKLKEIVAQSCDAIGTLYRTPEKENTNILSFATRGDDLVTGARPAHVSGEEFEISEMIEENGVKNLVTHWEYIFPYLSK